MSDEDTAKDAAKAKAKAAAESMRRQILTHGRRKASTSKPHSKLLLIRSAVGFQHLGQHSCRKFKPIV
jgi:hypothetical protein